MRANGVKALFGIVISIVSIVLLYSGNIESYWKFFVLGEICYVVFCIFAIKESVAELFFACLLI